MELAVLWHYSTPPVAACEAVPCAPASVAMGWAAMPVAVVSSESDHRLWSTTLQLRSTHTLIQTSSDWLQNLTFQFAAKSGCPRVAV